MNGYVENTQIPLKFLNRPFKTIRSESQLDNYVKSTILEWAEKDYTCPYAIHNYIKQTIQPDSMKLYFSNSYNNIRSWKSHTDLVQEVTGHILTMLYSRPAVTFLDIRKMIEAICGNGLHIFLGPISKIPLVKNHIFGNTDVKLQPPDIRLSDLIFDCANFLTDKINASKNTNEMAVVNSQSEKQFENYLKKKYHINEANLLGVKITNFRALCDAAYAAKADSFHKLIDSESLIQLLRIDVKKAIKRIRATFTSSTIFQMDSQPLDNLAKFANLPFCDAVKLFFQPFLDAEERVFRKHSLSRTGREEQEDSLAVVRKIINLLVNNKMHGRLFQLAAIAGTIHDCNTLMNQSTNRSSEKSETCQVLVTIPTDEWKSRIFLPLLGNVNVFNQLYLSQIGDVTKCFRQLDVVLKMIIEKCRAISQLFPNDTNDKIYDNISGYKQQHLISLANCCRIIAAMTIADNHVQLHIDLLPQAHYLIVLILSRCKLNKPQLLPATPIINEHIVECVFTAQLWHHIKQFPMTSQQRISLKSLNQLEQSILNVLTVAAWPLDGSFASFFNEHSTTVQEIIDGRSSNTSGVTETDTEMQMECRCIGLRQEFLQQIIRQLPARSISLNQFLSNTLPSLHGVVQLPTNCGGRSQLETLWNDITHREGHLLADGLPPAIDIRASVIDSTIASSSVITDSERVMRAISAVPLLSNAPFVMKWNALYRNCWGDICHFVNDHAQLAAEFNVRLIHSEIGIVRICAAVTGGQVDDAISVIRDCGVTQTALVQLVGLVVSLLVVNDTVCQLELARIIDGLSCHWIDLGMVLGRSLFAQFSTGVFTIVPSELVIDVAVRLVHPLLMKISSASDDDNDIGLFACLDNSVAILLKTGLPVGHPLLAHVDRPVLAAAAIKPVINDHRPAMDSSLPKPIYINDQYMAHTNNKSVYEDQPQLQIDLRTEGEILEEQQNCRAIVEDIRVNEFGVGWQHGQDNDSNNSSGLVASFNRKMARLVEHLSSDLYANATHFVLELVQNADDNRYLPGGGRPTLELSWMQTQPSVDSSELMLVVRNNEAGFTERDLRSLCDIGASTKGQEIVNKIGRKGIGFKSVFLVSDRPEIHSNGFHIRFERYRRDETNTLVSNNALVPTWCDPPSITTTATTTIMLPITKSLAKTNIRQSVAAQLRPHLLLFLRNLTRISISLEGECEKSIELVHGECSSSRKVVVTDTGERYSWLICTRRLAVTDEQLRQLSPRGVSHTELCVAIPDNIVDTGDENGKDWPAFAFLPIRSYGLRFIVNADFSIPASREDIAHDSGWNRWLIGQLGDMFTGHVRDCATGAMQMGQIIRLIECVPLPGEVPGDTSFYNLIPQLRASLSRLAWLPDRLGRLHAPTQLIAEVVLDTTGCSALTELLCDRLQLSLLHPDIAGSPSDRVARVLNWLGCQALSLVHLSKLLGALTPTDIADRCLMTAVIQAVHGAIERDSMVSPVTTQRVLIQLGSLPIWPVMTNGGSDELISISNSPLPVFLPGQQSISIDQYHWLRRIISHAFIATHEPPVTDGNNDNKRRVNAATAILHRLNVPELSSPSMLTYAINPALSPQRATPSRKWLISAAQFLVEQCHPTQYRDTILPLLSFATTHHTVSSSQTKSIATVSDHNDLRRVYLDIGMEAPHSGFVTLLHGRIEYMTIDTGYLAPGTGGTPAQWREFFLAAGACDTFYHDNGRYPDIEALLTLDNMVVNIELLRYLDRNWHIGQSGTILGELSKRACIPVCTNAKAAASVALHQPDDELALSLSITTVTSDSIVMYLCSNDPNKQMMPDSLLPHFPFCPIVFQHDALPQRIGLTNHVSLDHITTLLRSVLVTGAVRLTGRQSMDLYRWVQQNLSPSALTQLFSQLRLTLGGALLLALPGINIDDPCDLILDQGCYWTLPIADTSMGNTGTRSVYLHDQQVLEDMRQLLQATNNTSGSHRSIVKLFPEMRDLFVDVMQIRQFPAVGDIWGTLNGLLSLLTPDRIKDQLNHAEMELLTDVYNVVAFLDQQGNQEHKSDLLQLPLIPCISGEFRAFTDNTNKFSIYAWRSFETVHAFQQHFHNDDTLPLEIDFLAINCFPHIRRDYHHNNQHNSSQHVHRWTSPEFLIHYFNLPVLEDEMRFQIDNRDAFQPSGDVKTMLANLEVIISQWFQRNVSRDGVVHCVSMLSSLTECCSSTDGQQVAVAVSLRAQPHIGYRYMENVHIGSAGGDRFEILLGGVDLREGGMQVLDNVMDAIIEWILRGDSFSHLRDRFRKFYRSLFDLIESSDRNQVSIFIRSHNLRINPFSIDYIYETFATHLAHNTDFLDSVPVPSPVILSNDDSDSPLDDSLIAAASSPAAVPDRSNRSLKRKMCVTIDNNFVPLKQIRFNDESVENVEEIELEDGEEEEEEQQEIVAITKPNRQLKKKIQNRLVIQNTDSPQGRCSPLSTRVKEQFTNQKCGPLTTVGAASGNVAQISGRIGEQLAFEKLSISQCLGEWEIIRVDWVNQHTESKLPYDFKLTTRRPDSTVPEIIYLEVKATTQPKKRQFDLSPQEVTAAWSFKDSYHLLLVFHSGNYPDDNIKFVHIPDTLGQLQDNQCKLLFDVGDLLDQ